ncbi:MAG TPA: SusC/RagA family TonB-linked outer membrane protein [Longimicrobiales bacterium]|nr:SusC/RagA family TonB-linked outer membrane protein [Longimicrobiales bacterium]
MARGPRILLVLLGLLLGALPLTAQETGTVAGRVLDSSAQTPLADVVVSIGERSMITGQDGRFMMVGLRPGSYTVRASRLGFAEVTREVTVTAGATVTIDIVLAPSAIQLEGLVAVGYGPRRQAEVTGSVAQISPEQFNTGLIMSPERLIQSKIAGVQVIDNTEPGGEVSIRIRGGTSVTGSNAPLFVVDGVPIAIGGGVGFGGRNPLNFINPEDIANITVLKDAAATAIYGSRGANGVILIETRSGAAGTGMSYSGSVSSARVVGQPDLLNAQQFREAVAQYAPERLTWLGDATTNWQNAVQRDGFAQEHTLSFGGAAETMSYRLSLGFVDQEGVVLGSDTRRVSGSLNYSQRLFEDRLSLRTSLLGSRTEDHFQPGGVVGAANAFAPTQPIRDDTSSFGGFWEWIEVNGPNNPVSEIQNVQDRATSYRSVGSLTADWQLPYVSGLKATGRFGYDVIRADRQQFYPSFIKAQAETDSGRIQRENPSQFTKLLETFLTYDRALDAWQSNVQLTGGYTYEDSRSDFPTLQALGLSTDLLGPNGIPGSAERLTTVSIEENRLISFFGRMHYTLRDRYMLTASLRRDGSSRFSEDNQWGTFPAIAAAWRISGEPFMQNLGTLSDLKLRASWGVNGNQAVGNYLSYLDYRLGGPRAQYQFGDEYISTMRPSAKDPNLKWEETTSWNIGLDYGLFDNRLYGSIEYYKKDTDDLIFEVPVPNGSNLSDRVTTNVGNMTNRGVELALEALMTRPRSGGFSWVANFNAAYNKNELTRIYAFGEGTEQIPWGDAISGGVGSRIQILSPGQPINTFFVYRTRQDGNPVWFDRDGDGTIEDSDMYQDTDGDGDVDLDDRVPFEKAAPDWIFGHSSRLGYRNFDMSFTLRAQLGNYVYNNVASNQGYYDALVGPGHVNNLHRSVLDNNFTRPQYFADIYVEDASFLRMDNISLGYTFRPFTSGQQVRVFGAVQNVFTLTGYSGVDPTAGVNGIDNNLYPRSRTFTAGAAVQF